MGKKFFFTVLATSSLFFLWTGLPSALEKVRYGTMKGPPPYEIPMLAAEEKRIWEQQGLEVDWASFRTSSDHARAVTAGLLDAGTMETIPALLSASRGAPLVIVASLNQRAIFSLWVLTESAVKTPADLKDRRVGAVSLHDLTGSYGKFLKKALNTDFKVVGTGSVPAMVAALKGRIVDAIITAPGALALLLVKGELRELIALEDYLPRPWNEYHVYARKEFADASPERTKRTTRAMLQAGDFVRQNPSWVIAKIKEKYAYPEAAAKFIYDYSFKQIGGRGQINSRGLENVRNFLLEYELMAREKALPAAAIYTNKFLE